MEGTDLGIRKQGVYKKLKTSKKKYFVLRERTSTTPACLDYYDSEKKIKPGTKPKRSVQLASCLSINAKFDAKHNHTVVLFTQDDCLGMVFDNEADQQEWLYAMHSLQEEEGATPNKYEHVWQVTVKPKGLANGKNITPGTYRLCLTKKTLSFVKLNVQNADLIFQLATIRKCGHQESFFLIEPGTNSPTGAGDLWMQVEDSVVARNMHDTILKSMRSSSGGEVMPLPFRHRSHTHSSTDRPHRASTKRNSVGESSTLPRKPRSTKHMSMYAPASEPPSSPSWKRHSQSPSKSGSSYSLRPKSSIVTRELYSMAVSPGHSPLTISPLSGEMRCRADSMESRSSRRTDNSSVSDDPDQDYVPSSAVLARSITPDNPDYLAMTPGHRDVTVNLSPEAPTPVEEGYMEMSSPAGSTNKHIGVSLQTETEDQYMQMSPGNQAGSDSYLSMTQPSPSLSTASSGIGTEDSAYFDMSNMGNTLAQVKKKLDGGYMEMSHSTPNTTSSEGLRPDKVPSLLSDTESLEEFPKRAYSVGSKPVPIQPQLGEAYAYMDLQGKKNIINKDNPRTCSAPQLLEDLCCHLEVPTSPQAHSHSSSRSSTPRSGTPSQFLDSEPSDLLMELDFHNKSGGSRESLSDFRSRTSSDASKDMQSRLSSFGMEFRDRTDSAGSRDSRGSRTGSDNFRGRTQTVCQESIRPRTSSFGAVDNMRPRSASHGTSRFRELSRRLKEKALRHSFIDQIKINKKMEKQASKESIGSQHSQASHGSAVETADSEYIDIEIKTGNHDQPHNSVRPKVVTDSSKSKQIPSEEGYMMINPPQVGDNNDSSYQKATKHVHMSPKIETIIDESVTKVTPQVKHKSSISRKESSSFKHSSSSESVSSTSSADYSSKMKGKNLKSSPVTASADYYEIQVHNHPPVSKMTRPNSQSEVSGDSYALFSPDSGLKSHPSMDVPYTEKMSSPISEESLPSAYLGLEKIVSPIREEDNEAIFGPKPKASNLDKQRLEKLQKSLNHEYVNLKFKDKQQKTGVQTTPKQVDVSQEDDHYTEMSFPPKKERNQPKAMVDNQPKSKVVNPSHSTQAATQDMLPTTDSPVKPTSSFSFKPRVEHEYCEIEYDVDSSKKQKSPVEITKKPSANKDEYVENVYLSKPPVSDLNMQGVKHTGAIDQVNEAEQVPMASPTAAPFDLIDMPNIRPTEIPPQGSSQSWPVAPSSDSATTMDVFSLGAKPSFVQIDKNRQVPSSTSTEVPSAQVDKSKPLPSGSCSELSGTQGLTKFPHGSTSSLSALEIGTFEKLRTHNGSSSGINSMSNPGDRRSYQESSTEGGSSSLLGSRHTSRTSLGSIDIGQSPALNYATLDLSGSQDEIGLSQNTAQISPGSRSLQNPLTVQEEHRPISYAQIDFEKSCAAATTSKIPITKGGGDVS